MGDALISPTVGGLMLAASAGIVLYSAKKVRREFDPDRVPFMGVMGAFVFAMQMINFAIPATGSSGHIGGGVLLAALLGPYSAFLTLSCVLLIQALFFADGGLLALGCNIFNLGFFTCFIAYPLVFKPIAGDFSKPARVLAASLAACIVGLQLGAFCVVLETTASGAIRLPFAAFVGAMQSVHLAIGVVEGILTSMALSFIILSYPKLFSRSYTSKSFSKRAALVSIFIASIAIGGGLSTIASTKPDGLEWSLEKIEHEETPKAESEIHSAAGKLQENSSALPDYSTPGVENPALSTSIAGTLGAFITLAFVAVIGFSVRGRRKNRA